MLDYDDSAFKFFFVSILAFYLIPATIYTLNVISSHVFAKVINVFFHAYKRRHDTDNTHRRIPT